MFKIKKVLISILLCFSMLLISVPSAVFAGISANSFSFVILSDYLVSADIGDQFYLIGITSTGDLPTFKSSNSSVASVNTYGLVTAKKAGTATITAKIKNAEASCIVTVVKTTISLNKTTVSLEHGETFCLTGSTSTGSALTYKSSKKSVATIDEDGVITALKPGETTITASADGTKATCKVTVKSPTVKLSKSSITLYRGQTATLTATVSSNLSPSYKSNRKSVATIDESGTITAVKHGTAVITATIDGVSKTCIVTVKQPTITLNETELTLTAGETYALTATVSSGNTPVFSSSNTAVATVDESGTITTLKKGTAYIYAKEDGVKVKCKVKVTAATEN